ncbi:MAG: hypothetical protein ACR2QF_17925 [Geminicoccaceae bacterium]
MIFKKAVIGFLIIYLVLGGLYALVIGYYTYTFAANAGLKHRDDYIDHLQHAYLDDRNYMHVCLQGELVTDRSVTEFTYSFPTTINDANRESIDASGYTVDDVNPGFMIIPRAQIREGCDDVGNLEITTAQPVHIESVSLAYASQMSGGHDLASTLTSSERYTLYQVTRTIRKAASTKSKDIILVGNQPVSFGVHYSFVEARMAKVEGSPLWYLAVPFGFVFDALTFPLQIMAWIGYAQSH